MTIVLFHSADRLPSYLECTFKQIRLFNPDVMVYFLTDAQHLNNPLFTQYYIKPVNKNAYLSKKLSLFRMFYGHPTGSFWMVTALRLIYIEEFLKAKKLKDVYLFENDIMIYYTLAEHHQRFCELYKNKMAITVGGPDKCMTGFSFIPNWGALADMTQWFIDTLKRLGEQGVLKKFRMDMVNEMTLMKAYMDEEHELISIPSLPFGVFYNMCGFNSIFDPAGWGQFVGGTIQDCIPGAKPQDHYIGQMLMKNPDYTVIWKRDKEGE